MSRPLDTPHTVPPHTANEPTAYPSMKRRTMHRTGEPARNPPQGLSGKVTMRRSTSELADFRIERHYAEVLRVVTACDPPSREYFPQTLFAAGEALVGPCAAKTTIYCANIAAGLMTGQFAKYLRDIPAEPDLQLNLLTSESVSYTHLTLPTN